VASFVGKTGWRTQPFVRPQPLLPVAGLFETVAAASETDETPIPFLKTPSFLIKKRCTRTECATAHHEDWRAAA
jgi:hypothetical protein